MLSRWLCKAPSTTLCAGSRAARAFTDVGNAEGGAQLSSAKRACDDCAANALSTRRMQSARKAFCCAAVNRDHLAYEDRPALMVPVPPERMYYTRGSIIL